MQKIFFVLLLIAVVSVAIAPLAYSEVNVSDHPDNTKKLSPKSFGNKDRENKVCGDKLCEDSIGISDSITIILSSNT